jgi:hypothetical protein
MNNLDIPEDDKLDIVHKSTKALLNLIPIVGGTVTEIFNSLVISPIEKRRNEWMQEVVNALKKLEESRTGIVQELSSNEEFVSLLISSSINAFKTHISEKHKKLKNGLINSVDNGFTYDINQVFINFIDELTITHLTLLSLINQYEDRIINLDEYQQIYDILISQDSEKVQSIKQMEITMFRFLLKDLESKGLLFISSDISEIENKVSESSFLLTEDSGNSQLPFIRVTNFGNSFLTFIEEEN